MKKAVISGSPRRATAVAARLEAAGYEVLQVNDLPELHELADRLQPCSIDGYVQLPVEVHATGPTIIERLRQFLDGGLLARYEAVGALLPAVRDDGQVLLVSGN